MPQIKLSIAFVLAAAAIAPVVAQPIAEVHEFAGNVGHCHHHPHHHRHSIPETTSDTTLSPSRREYADEFEVRGLLFGQNDDPNLLNSLENRKKTLEHQDAELEQKHKSLECEDRHLEHKNRRLKHKERYLEHKDHRLEREDRKLEHTKHSLKRQDRTLLGRKRRLEGEDNKLNRKRKTLEGEDKALGREGKILARKGKALARQNDALRLKGEALGRHDIVLAKEGEDLAHHDKVLAQEGKALGRRPVVHSEPEIVAREYAEDDMFERDLDDIASGAKSAKTLRPLPRVKRLPKLLPLGHGPAVVFPRPHNRFTSFRPPFGHGPVVRNRPYHEPFTPHTRLSFGLGPVVPQPHYNPFTRWRPNFGTGPEIPRNGQGVVVREYAGFDDMFERDLEDVEIDARDFDELYLD